MTHKVEIAAPDVDNGLPEFQSSDFCLTEGTLILLDASHSFGGLGPLQNPQAASPATLVSDDGYIQNIAWEKLNALVGGSAASFSGAVNCRVSRQDGAGFSIEFTEEGGLHGIVDIDGTLGSGVGFTIRMPTEVRAYLAANPTHKYFLAVEQRITRAAVKDTSTAPATVIVQSTTAGTSNYLAFFDMDGNKPTSGTLGSTVDPGPNDTTGPTLRCIAVDGWTGTDPTTSTDVREAIAFWGAHEAYTTLSGSDNPPSWVLYRLLLEDLTVSGRSFAVASRDAESLFDYHHGAAGKFYGDSWTDPEA
jgi:hypothetical protein